MLYYACEISYQAILRYDTFKATAFDLGNMDQAVWNTLHGRFFQFTNQGIDWYGPPTRLAQHVEPILLPLSLLYLLYSDPRTLLVFQTLVLASGALPVFLLTRHHLRAWPLFAPVMAAAYLFSPALLGINLFDFHPISLVTPLLLYAMLALTYKRYVWFVICCILAAACKEEIGLIVALLGVMVIWKYKLPRLGIALIIGGVLWSGLAFFVIMPRFYPGTLHNNFWYRYEALGSSPTKAIINILLHPWILLSYVTLDRIYYLAGLIRNVGFLAILAPEWFLPALPSLALNMLSSDSNLYSGVYHYNAPIIPFIMMAAIIGTQRVITLWQTWRGEKAPEALTITARTASASLIHTHIGANMGTRLALALSPALTLTQTLTHTITSSPVLQHTRLRVQSSISSLVDSGNRQWQRFGTSMTPLARIVSVPRLQWFTYLWLLLMLGLNFTLLTPPLNAFWASSVPGSREQHIQQLINMIPPDASVSASDTLNPHLSERLYITIFPSITYSNTKGVSATVQYVIIDVNSVQGTFPEDRVDTINVLNQLIKSKQFCPLQRAEGVILLKHCST
jgi:uncharacterized membrane protein